ncbi:hypothetical protein F5Y08DRAFT_113502 [Xylaria arbuscula]|nr:hypothetical protein F5Y08DRAFT_113502 [Xylaria arbuscula]
MDYHPEPRSQPRSRPPITPLKSFKGRGVTGEERGDFLDRWSPQLDHGHYSRVRLHRERRDSVSRFRRRQGEHHRAVSSLERVRASEESDVRSTHSYDSDCSLLSPASTDLGSTFQDELDNYDEMIKTLRPGEWPAPPNARARAVRVDGKEFSNQKAKALKSWGFAQGMLYGGNSASLRDTDNVHPPTSYSPGVIFSAPHHTAGEDTQWVSVSDPNNTATPFGIVHSKYRKMVVLKVFAEHCTCVPIYSHNGRGLEGRANVAEYVSIRDAGDENPEMSEGLHATLFAVGNQDFRGRIVKGKSSVKLTEVCSHRFNAPATIEGKLQERGRNSKQLLLRLVDRMNS